MKKKKKVEEQTESKTQKWVQIRLLPIWLRILLVLLLLVGAAVFGAMFGYGYLGDGNPGDVLKKETWTHIYDIMNGKQS
ncbi:DNA-directed RNA polymerase subunit beta [Sporosarcina sp. FSL K6-1522]|uniref:DNA-directed RNA polymerase subunit beta n=1 Tax=Sporosarcina sp. FSL K6-1522 TaxID=2921554 RepID=UPI00315ABF84